MPSGVFHDLMVFVSWLSSGPADVLWAALIAGFWISQRRVREALFLFFGTALGSAFTPLLKGFFSTARPPGGADMDSYAFPSGHVLSITLLTVLLAWLRTRRIPGGKWLHYGAAAAIVGMVGASRVYLDVHWPIDIAGGIAFGLLIAWGWIAACRSGLGKPLRSQGRVARKPFSR
jgi:undecaprenyl-diphosphatase